MSGRGMVVLYGGPPTPGGWERNAGKDLDVGKMIETISSLPDPVPAETPVEVPGPDLAHLETLLAEVQRDLMALRLDRQMDLPPEAVARIDVAVGKLASARHILDQ